MLDGRRARRRRGRVARPGRSGWPRRPPVITRDAPETPLARERAGMTHGRRELRRWIDWPRDCSGDSPEPQRSNRHRAPVRERAGGRNRGPTRGPGPDRAGRRKDGSQVRSAGPGTRSAKEMNIEPGCRRVWSAHGAATPPRKAAGPGSGHGLRKGSFIGGRPPEAPRDPPPAPRDNERAGPEGARPFVLLSRDTPHSRSVAARRRGQPHEARPCRVAPVLFSSA